MLIVLFQIHFLNFMAGNVFHNTRVNLMWMYSKVYFVQMMCFVPPNIILYHEMKRETLTSAYTFVPPLNVLEQHTDSFV